MSSRRTLLVWAVCSAMPSYPTPCFDPSPSLCSTHGPATALVGSPSPPPCSDPWPTLTLYGPPIPSRAVTCTTATLVTPLLPRLTFIVPLISRFPLVARSSLAPPWSPMPLPRTTLVTPLVSLGRQLQVKHCASTPCLGRPPASPPTPLVWAHAHGYVWWG